MHLKYFILNYGKLFIAHHNYSHIVSGVISLSDRIGKEIGFIEETKGERTQHNKRYRTKDRYGRDCLLEKSPQLKK